jgi:hypothetical protein
MAAEPAPDLQPQALLSAPLQLHSDATIKLHSHFPRLPEHFHCDCPRHTAARSVGRKHTAQSMSKVFEFCFFKTEDGKGWEEVLQHGD